MCWLNYETKYTNSDPSSLNGCVILKVVLILYCSWLPDEFLKASKNEGDKIMILLHCHPIWNRSIDKHAFSSSGNYCAVLHSTSWPLNYDTRVLLLQARSSCLSQKSLCKSASPLPQCSSNSWRWANNVVRFKVCQKMQPRRRITVYVVFFHR